MNTRAKAAYDDLVSDAPSEPPSEICDGDPSLKGKYYGAIYEDGSMLFFIRVIGMKGRGIPIIATSLEEALSELKKCNKEHFSRIVTQLWLDYGRDRW